MLTVQSPTKGAEFQAHYPKIGSKFKGPAEYLDTQSGVMWVCLPKLTADEERIQKALLKKDKPKVVFVDFIYDLKDLK